MSEKKEKKQVLMIVAAVYTGGNVVISTNKLPIQEVTNKGILVERNSSIVDDFVSTEKLNKASAVNISDDTVSLFMYAHKMSEFAIKSELRTTFLKTLDERRVRLEKLIRNFEESFKNAK